MRDFFLVVGNPTDDGIAFAAIIGLFFVAAPNEGGLDESGTTMNNQKPKPGQSRLQRREQKIEVYHDG